MFLGSFEPSFDINSRRLALPKKIRTYLAKNEVILSFGFEKCIFGFDTGTFAYESKKQLKLSLSERSARDLRRIFFSGAERISLDDQGRIVIPNSLLEYAEVKRPVIIGAGDHFEVWDNTIWQKERLKLER